LVKTFICRFYPIALHTGCCVGRQQHAGSGPLPEWQAVPGTHQDLLVIFD
jgi:hypothetical protein